MEVKEQEKEGKRRQEGLEGEKKNEKAEKTKEKGDRKGKMKIK